MPTIKFTEAVVRGLTSNGKARVEYRDTDVPDLLLRVTRNGVKSFSVFRKQRGMGSAIRVTLDNWPRLSVHEARQRARTAAASLGQGVNPNEEIRAAAARKTAEAARNEITLRIAMQEYFKVQSLRPGTELSYRRDLQKTFGRWLDQPLVMLAPADVKAAHKRRSSESRTRADGALRALKAIRTYASAQHDLPLPAITGRTVRFNGTPTRTTRLAGDRVAWIRKVRALPDSDRRGGTSTQRDALLVLLSTGLRLREVCHLRWDEVDHAAGILTIGVDRHKGKRGFVLPLPPRAAAIINARHSTREEGEKFVFPGGHKGKALDRIARGTFALIGIKCTAHDLRREAATAAAIRLPLAFVRQLLGHAAKAGNVTEGYIQPSNDELREAFTQVEDALYAGVEIAPSSKPARTRRLVKATKVAKATKPTEKRALH